MTILPLRRPGFLRLFLIPSIGLLGALQLACAAAPPRQSLSVSDPGKPAPPPSPSADIDRAAARKAIADAKDLTGEPRLRALENAVDLWRRAGDAEEEVATLIELGIAHRGLDQVMEAIQCYEKAIARADETGNRGGKADALQSLGVALDQQGEGERALQAYNGALEIWTELEDPGGRGKTLYSIGQLYARDDPIRALELFQEALPLRRAANDLSGEVNTLNAISGAYSSLGKVTQARESLELALNLSGDVKEEVRAALLQAAAAFDQGSGELQKALDRYEQALRIFEREGNRSWQSLVLHNRAGLFLGLGDIEAALGQYQSALQLCRSIEVPCPVPEAQILANLGWAQHVLHPDQPEVALGNLEQAYRLANDASNQALALYYMGQVHRTAGELDVALPYFERSSSLWAGKPVERIKCLLALGETHQALGDPQEAAGFFAEALALGRRLENPGVISQCLFRQAALHRDGGELEKGLGEIEEAVGLVEGVRRRVANDDLRTSFFASRRPFFDLYIDLLMRMHERNPGEGYDEKAFHASEQARARGLLDLLAEGRIDVTKGIAPELKRRETELDAELGYLQNRLLSELGAPRLDEGQAARLREQIEQAKAEQERLREQITREYPQYAAILYPKPLSLTAVQGLLDGQTAFCEYTMGAKTSYLFVVTKDRLHSYPLPGEDELERAVQGVREALAERSERRSLHEYVRQAARLYQWLLAPAAQVLKGKSRLLISPDGPLLVLPFDALLTESALGKPYGELPYLLRRFAITSVPSAGVLDELRTAALPDSEGAVAPKAFLAFSDPIYEDGSAGPERPARRLEESAREVREIANLFPAAETEVYERGAATEANVEGNELLKTSRLIHFATHGFIDEARPYLSGLVLTRTANPDVDGILRVHEIFNLRLSAGLVVLSACETGLGQRVSGEGLIGLTRAFLYAGADSLVVSLWRVSDRSTADLMVDFYKFLKAGEDKVTALQRAKLRKIEAGGRSAHPFYWAPFVLTGDPSLSGRNIFPLQSPVTN